MKANTIKIGNNIEQTFRRCGSGDTTVWAIRYKGRVIASWYSGSMVEDPLFWAENKKLSYISLSQGDAEEIAQNVAYAMGDPDV